MNTRSLYFRLILWYSGLVILVLLGFAAYTYQGVRMRLYGEMEQTLARRAHQIADNILVHADAMPQEEIGRHIREVYSPSANNRFIRILKADRTVLYVSSAPKDGAFDPQTVPLPAGWQEMRAMETLPTGASMLVVNLPVQVAGKEYLIEMGTPAQEIQSALHGLEITLVIGLPVVVLIATAGGYALVGRALKPVEDIRATAEQITFGNLSNRLPVPATGDALEHLSVTLNQMLQRLEDAYQQVSRFSADASHELRTPLTIMRGELEAIIHREPNLSEGLRERIGSVLEEVERLSRITESLFTISRIDAGEGKAKPVTFYLVDLVKSTTEQMLLLAEVKTITMLIEARDPVKVTADASRLKQVIVNLVDNAIKYTPSGGRIFVTISENQHRACLAVADTGIGIHSDAMPHIFERFYRTDKARSREEGGAGLGLSIVRSVVQSHGGAVEVESQEGRGTTFRVLLPLAEANYETTPPMGES